MTELRDWIAVLDGQAEDSAMTLSPAEISRLRRDLQEAVKSLSLSSAGVVSGW